MKALTIGALGLKRMFRERSNIFFVFIFPIALVMLIGVQFGGDFKPAVLVYQGDDGVIATEIVDALIEGGDIDIRVAETSDDLVAGVEHGSAQAGLEIPAGVDETAANGDVVDFGYVSRPDGGGVQIQSLVSATIAEVMKPVGAAQFAVVETGARFPETIAAATQVSAAATPIEVEVLAVGDALFPSTLGQFDLGASSQLVLFTFLTALAGSASLILTRQLGISSRMMSTPTRLGTIIVGESLGRFNVAVAQGLYIMILTLVIFDVNWGDPLAAVLILVALSAVGAGAAMLMGATFKNDQQAGGIAVMLSLGLAALGGAMFPAELFSPTMQKVAHITPHAWALDGYAELVRHGGNTLDILPELGVLSLYAAVLLGLAAWRLRAAITNP